MTCDSGPRVTVLHAKTTDGSWDKLRLVILNLSTLFCMHKTTGDVWFPERLVILVLSTLFCLHKSIDEVWNPQRQVILVVSMVFCLIGLTQSLLS